MANTHFYSLDSCLTALINKITESENKELYLKYFSETIERCYNLCKNGEETGALNEVKFMVINLKKQLKL